MVMQWNIFITWDEISHPSLPPSWYCNTSGRSIARLNLSQGLKVSNGRKRPLTEMISWFQVSQVFLAQGLTNVQTHRFWFYQPWWRPINEANLWLTYMPALCRGSSPVLLHICWHLILQCLEPTTLKETSLADGPQLAMMAMRRMCWFVSCCKWP